MRYKVYPSQLNRLRRVQELHRHNYKLQPTCMFSDDSSQTEWHEQQGVKSALGVQKYRNHVAT